MKNFSMPSHTARIVLNPYDTDITRRKDMASRYALPLRSLHMMPPQQITRRIEGYANDLNLFLGTVEDTFERPDIKVRLLLCPVSMGIENIAESARHQERQREIGKNKEPQTPATMRHAYAAATSSIISDFNRSISVNTVMYRLLRIAENRTEDAFVREQALQALAAAHSHATWVFGQEISFAPYDDRITALALSLPRSQKRLGDVALGLIDSVRPSRSPSIP